MGWRIYDGFVKTQRASAAARFKKHFLGQAGGALARRTHGVARRADEVQHVAGASGATTLEPTQLVEDCVAI